MLVLSRRESERIKLGDSIVVTVVKVAGDRVRLGIEAPRACWCCGANWSGAPSNRPCRCPSRHETAAGDRAARPRNCRILPIK